MINMMREPSLKCIDLCVNELSDVITTCCDNLAAFPNLRDEVDRIVKTKLRDCHFKANEQVEMLMRLELSYMNTNHPDFIGFAKCAACWPCATAHVVH